MPRFLILIITLVVTIIICAVGCYLLYRRRKINSTTHVESTEMYESAVIGSKPIVRHFDDKIAKNNNMLKENEERQTDKQKD